MRGGNEEAADEVFVIVRVGECRVKLDNQVFYRYEKQISKEIEPEWCE